MLQEPEIEERARYCYLVFLQLSWLHGNDFAQPGQYLDYLAKSSLGLGTDEFITVSVRDALGLEARPDGGLPSLISLYEAFTHAFCQVLEKEVDEIRAQIPSSFLKQLAEEMGVGDHL
ncbi:MAG: hypothetical protein ABSE08_04040 [Syntrophobacteraceae bacterium]|jgi:hypothetical protein